MRFDAYAACLREDYSVGKRLSDKAGASALVLTHREKQKSLVLRRFDRPVPVYDYLLPRRHENLPLVYDVIPLEDAIVVLEEYIDGLSVAEVLESGCYAPHGAKRVLCGVCDALTALHTGGFLHRDVKPENVMITTAGTVKLVDFDIARPMALPGREDDPPRGTIGYAPPEQLGLAREDVRSDLYAAGVLLNVMLTGKHPSECLARGRAGRIVRRCTQIAPESRVQSAAELRRLLQIRI